MSIKFTASWAAAGGPPTPAIREIGTAFDTALGYTASGFPGALAIAQAAAAAAHAESDGQAPLHIARVDAINPSSLGPLIMTAIGGAADQWAAAFTATELSTPPPAAFASAAFLALFPAASFSPTLVTAVGTYIATCSVGGQG